MLIAYGLKCFHKQRCVVDSKQSVEPAVHLHDGCLVCATRKHMLLLSLVNYGVWCYLRASLNILYSMVCIYAASALD